MPQPACYGYPLQDWYAAQQHGRCVFVTRIEMKIGSHPHSAGGQQMCVVTPGQNETHYFAATLHSDTGKVSYTYSTNQGSSLFVGLLKHLKSAYRREKTIMLIADDNVIKKL